MMHLVARKDPAPRILLTGATGYVGGRLLRLLEAGGHRVRCLARQPEYLRDRVAQSTEVVTGDVLDPSSLVSALEGVHTAFYLVHSMGGTGDAFEERDRRAAQIFADAAREAGVARLVYLGGLGAGTELSPHLRSRQEVGEILRASGIPTVELRASIIIGSGSLSFEMIRALVEKLPIMITPSWVRVLAQPIAIEDVLAYLVAAIDLPRDDCGVFEIGGPDRVSYGDLMQEYARQRGLRRLMIPVPALTPRLSSLWLGLVTPLYARVGRKLIDSLRNETIVTSNDAQQVFSVRPRGVREAIERALVNEDRDFAETRWNDAGSAVGELPRWGGKKLGSRMVDSRVQQVSVSRSSAFRPIRRIGGATGWYYGDWLWGIRGFLDLLLGGAGLRRGRRDPEQLRVGDTVDFWRVEAFEANRLLRLRAEMKLPGRAWLQFEVDGDDDASVVRQTALFDPHGLLGLLYWYALYPMHHLVFGGMLAAIADAAERGGQRPRHMKQKPIPVLLVLAIFLLGPLAGASAQSGPGETAPSDTELQISLGAGFIASPRPYVGTEARVFPIPVLDVRYQRFFVQGIRTGYELVQRGPLTASVLAQARFAGLEPDDSPFLEGMETRKKSADAGIEVLYRGRPVGFRAAFLTDILGRSNGQVVSATAVTGAPIGPVLVLVGAGPTWYSQRRTDYYYGVRDEEARPGRPAYQPGATFNFDLNVTVRWAPSERWSLFVLINREALGSGIESSPIVGRGSAVAAVTSLTYSF